MEDRQVRPHQLQRRPHDASGRQGRKEDQRPVQEEQVHPREGDRRRRRRRRQRRQRLVVVDRRVCAEDMFDERHSAAGDGSSPSRSRRPV